jgi:hypothetical protein
LLVILSSLPYEDDVTNGVALTAPPPVTNQLPLSVPIFMDAAYVAPATAPSHSATIRLEIDRELIPQKCIAPSGK